MKKKIASLLIGAMAASSVLTCAPIMGFAEDQAAQETNAAVETESQTEEETSDFVEGSALLADYDYEAGELSEKDWSSDFLNMKYDPEKGIAIDMAMNDQINEKYYLRNGEDKQVGASEMVATDDDGGYVQLSVIANPNNEAEEDILERFGDDEELELKSKPKEMEIAGKTFQTMSGIKGKMRYMIAVSTDQPNFAIALKMRYQDTDSRDALLDGFSTVIAEAETEADTEAETTPAAETEVAINNEVSAADGMATGTETEQDAGLSTGSIVQQ